MEHAVLACGLEPNSDDIKTKQDLDELLIDLDAHSNEPLSIADLIDARISLKAVVRIYGSWGNARMELGLKIGRKFSLSIDELLDDLGRVAAGATKGFSMTEYVSRGGKYAPSTFCRAFDGWNPALTQAGLSPRHVLGIDREELIRELQALAVRLGRTPLRDDINNYGRYPASLYYQRFSTLSAVAQVAGLPPNPQYAQPTAGDDGTIYDSSAEAQVANQLLLMQSEAEIRALHTPRSDRQGTPLAPGPTASASGEPLPRPLIVPGKPEMRRDGHLRAGAFARPGAFRLRCRLIGHGQPGQRSGAQCT